MVLAIERIMCQKTRQSQGGKDAAVERYDKMYTSTKIKKQDLVLIPVWPE